MKFVSLKVVLLLALTTAKRVSDLQALSIRPSCLQFAPGISKQSACGPIRFLCLRWLSRSIGVSRWNCVSPASVLLYGGGDSIRYAQCGPYMYVSRSAAFRKGDQLFVSWATPHRGKPLSRQRLSHWIVEAISLAYECRGLQPPHGLRAHSTRGMATSWALFRGVSVLDICAAASWATPHTFFRFYRLDVSGLSVSQAVRGTISPDTNAIREWSISLIVKLCEVRKITLGYLT